MKDYTHVKHPFAKPLLYKNDNKLHLNWIRLLETLVTGVVITFLLFIGARFGVFERTVVLQDTMQKDISDLEKGREYNAKCIQEIKESLAIITTIVTRNTSIIEGLTKDLKDIRIRQMDYYLRNQVERKEDLKPLMK
jgi:hypothetical protein